MRTMTLYLIVCLAAVLLPFLLAGCPGKVTNQPPVANAGADQNCPGRRHRYSRRHGQQRPGWRHADVRLDTDSRHGCYLDRPHDREPDVYGSRYRGNIDLRVDRSVTAPNTATDSVNVVVQVATTANAGPDQGVAPGVTVTLDGSASTAPCRQGRSRSVGRKPPARPSHSPGRTRPTPRSRRPTRKAG